MQVVNVYKPSKPKSHPLRRVGACKAGFRTVVVNRLARHVETQTTDCRANAHNYNVDDRQGNLARRGKVATPVEMQPVNTTETNCE